MARPSLNLGRLLPRTTSGNLAVRLVAALDHQPADDDDLSLRPRLDLRTGCLGGRGRPSPAPGRGRDPPVTTRCRSFARSPASATAADGGGSTARGLSASATARSRRSWAARWRRGSRRADRADAGAEAYGPGVPSPRERALVAVRSGAFDYGLPGGRVPSLRAGAADVVSDGAVGALCGFGGGDGVSTVSRGPPRSAARPRRPAWGPRLVRARP